MDKDIAALDHGTAREYVLGFLSSLKQAQRERAIAEEELGHWQGRVKLAENRGEPQLKKVAAQRAAELREQAVRLAEEERGLRRKTEELRRKLLSLRERQGFAVDAEDLLDQLRLQAGGPGASEP